MTSPASPFSPVSPDPPVSSTEPFPKGPVPQGPFPQGQEPRAPGTCVPPLPLVLDPEIKSAVEAQRASAMQYPDSLARLVGIMNAKVFENQYQQEELISRFPGWQGPGQGPATEADLANRNREMENTQRGRREFCRMVQIEAQLRGAKCDE